MQQFEEEIDAIYRCARVEELTAMMQTLAQQLGYASLAYVDVRRIPLTGEPLPFHQSTVRADFYETYRREGFVSHDPVILRAAVTTAPFTWADCPEFHARGRRRGCKTKALKVMEVAYDFGYTQGFVVPMHSLVGPRRELSAALLTLYWRDALEYFGTPDSMPWWLPMIVFHYHERMVALRGLTSSEPPLRAFLTDRERECLAWACRGKTSGDTADILGIGERTVEFHIQNAMKKLGVHNKMHAAAVVIRRGLIPV